MKSREQTIADMIDTKHQIGDWVQIIYSNGIKFVAKVISPDKVLEGGKEYQTTVESWDEWNPEEGEWCWVYNVTRETPYLRKVIRVEANYKNRFDDYKFTKAVIVSRGDTSEEVGYRFCEPFLGELPSTIEQY